MPRMRGTDVDHLSVGQRQRLSLRQGSTTPTAAQASRYRDASGAPQAQDPSPTEGPEGCLPPQVARTQATRKMRDMSDRVPNAPPTQTEVLLSEVQGPVVTHDPSKCYYSNPINCGGCLYCNGQLADASPRDGGVKQCGHPTHGVCPCIKYRREPPAWLTDANTAPA